MSILFWLCSVVEFASSSDMKSALDKLDGSELNGRRIKLIEDRKRRRYVTIYEDLMDLARNMAIRAGGGKQDVRKMLLPQTFSRYD